MLRPTLMLVLILAGCADELPARVRWRDAGPPAGETSAPALEAAARPLALDGSAPSPVPAHDGPPLPPLPPPDPPTPPAPPAPAPVGTIVPLYTYPTHASWSQLVQVKLAHPGVPVVAIVNVNNGPGPAPEVSYAAGIPKLAAAGVQVIGYVHTSYATRAEATVRSEIQKWKSFYPLVTGIFFDEQASTAGKESYYKSLGVYAKSLGLSFCVGNPGTDTSPSYIGSLDMMLIYESAGLPSLSALGGWHTNHARENFGIIPYAVSSLDPGFIASARALVGYIYLTSDDLPNPWDSLPAYFGQLVAELAR